MKDIHGTDKYIMFGNLAEITVSADDSKYTAGFSGYVNQNGKKTPDIGLNFYGNF